MCMRVSACLYIHHMHAGSCGGHKRVLQPLELELQAALSCLGHWCWEPNLDPL